ncbi:DUF3310 domain-containing protein [uncultured Mailhella sp.]|uniref:DUF3310 domain-containing protein n=1 Tax=uncultured Mailhella sp. TaxID=1981031 RepID=UPI0026155C3D|nr:DUF3310 domain-containing protein [uncultured Mailhella sp.]
MKLRGPKTGKVFDEIDSTKCYSNRKCLDCALDIEHNGYNEPCRIFVRDHPEEAARLMGYEVIEDRSCYNCKNYKGNAVCCLPIGIDVPVFPEEGCSIWEKKEDNMEKQDKPISGDPQEYYDMSDEMVPSVGSNVDHPAHYNQGGVECIDALAAATVGLEGIQAFCTANAIKYLWRWKSKGGVEDLDKAIWYINRLKEEIGNG